MARDLDDHSSEPTFYTFYSAMQVAQLTDYQRFQMKHHAGCIIYVIFINSLDMIQEFAVKFVEPYCLNKLNMTHPVVDVEAWRSINFRPFQVPLT